MRRILFGLSLAILPISANSSASAAQTSDLERPGRVPVTIVLTDHLPPDSRFVILRSPTSDRRDVIALRLDATTTDLSEAVNTLLTARQASGDIPSIKQTLRIRPPGSPKAKGQREYPWIPRVLGDLRRATHTDVPEVGRVRAVQIWLPAQLSHRPSRAKPRG